MKRLLVLAGCLLAVAACGRKLTVTESEEARRAKLELQSVMDMVSSRQIPPIDFELGSDKLKASSFELLDRVAAVLVNHTHIKLIVSGHTDDTGSAEYNEDLSLRRAGAVKFYLARKGVHPDSVRVYGYGERYPVVNEKTEEARALNRRVEFRVTTRNWGTVY